MTPLQTRLALLPARDKLADAAQSAVVAAGGEPPPWARWLDDRGDPRVSTLPPMLIPVAVSDTELLALDVCVEAIERGRLPVIGSTDGRFWRPVAPDLAALCASPTGGQPLDGLRFSEAARLAPSSFRVQAAEARRCRGASAADEAARVIGALRRPLHGARDLDEVRDMQERALALEAHAPLDPLTLRLARAGLDAEEWRTVGAERGVAGKTGDALRALAGAVFLGAPMEAVRPAWERLLLRAGWGWAQRLS